METNFTFIISPADAGALEGQVSRALEKRVELASRERMPKLWELTDKLNSVEKAPEDVLGNRRRRRRALGFFCWLLSLALIVAIFSFMLFSGTMVSANLQAGIQSLSARMGADLLVVPQGQGKKVESVILRAEPTTFYIDESLLNVVQKIDGVAQASGQLFISSLDAQCCSVKVQLIGIDQATDFVVGPWLKKASDHPLKENEVIVGDYIFGEIGSELMFYNQKFKIVGRLEPTGMGFDSSIFMTLDMARKLGEIATPEKADQIEKSLSAILVRVKPGVDPISISDGVLDQLGLRANVNFVFASNMMSDTSAGEK